MSDDLRDRIRRKARRKQYVLTQHAQMERFADQLEIASIEAVLVSGEVVEDYGDDPRGHSCLMLGEPGGVPIHMVVGQLQDDDEPLVVITVYRPDPQEWEADWRTRRRHDV